MRRRDAGNFQNWMTITARRSSSSAETECGHAIEPGEAIGYNHRTRKVKCARCWAAWQGEVAEAARLERGGW